MGVVDHKVSLVSGYENSRWFWSCVIHRGPVSRAWVHQSIFISQRGFPKMTRNANSVFAKTFNCEKESTCIKPCLLFWNWYAGIFLQVDFPSSFKSQFSPQRCDGAITRKGSLTSPGTCRNGSARPPPFGLQLRDCQVVILSSHWLFTSTRKILLHFHSFGNHNGTCFLLKAFVLTHRVLEQLCMILTAHNGKT